MINHVVIVGNLTRDPELRHTPSGMAVCEMGVAVNERWHNKQTGQNEEVAHFFDVTVWAGQAEACAQYLAKGRQVAVSGRLRQERWQDKNTGENRSKVKIVADRVQFLGGGQQGNGNGGGGQQQTMGTGRTFAQTQDAPPVSGGGGWDDDIPF